MGFWAEHLPVPPSADEAVTKSPRPSTRSSTIAITEAIRQRSVFTFQALDVQQPESEGEGEGRSQNFSPSKSELAALDILLPTRTIYRLCLVSPLKWAFTHER